MPKKEKPNIYEEKVAKVLINTIKFDNLLNYIFKTSMNLDEDQEDIEQERKWFDSYMFEQMGAKTKLDFLREIIFQKEGFSKKDFPTDFEGAFIDLYNIRNIFAHSLFPKQFSKRTNKQIENLNWEDLSKKHLELYKKLSKWIEEFFYNRFVWI